MNESDELPRVNSKTTNRKSLKRVSSSFQRWKSRSALGLHGDFVCHAHQHQYAEHSRNETSQHRDLECMPREVNAIRFGQPNDQRGKPNSEKSTGGIASAVNTEGEPSLFFIDTISDQCIARRACGFLFRADLKNERQALLPK